VSFEEILGFLKPGNDSIQLVFGSLVLTLALITLVAMWLGARPARWEKKWNGGGAHDLDVEHGSLNEISAAVASAGEKMADVMPGILLILGLLGTFLGLGIALNKASSILIEANAGGGMDNAMANLMGMMEGLGTKFKTSTWGIMAFLLIKTLASLSRYEERRLRWCIGKMKIAFEQGRHALREARENEQQSLLGALARIDQTLQSQLQASHGVLEQHFQLSKHGTLATGTALEATRQAVQELQQALVPQLQTLNASGLDACRSLSESTAQLQRHGEQNQQQLDDTRATRASLESFVEANSRNLGALSDAANQMAGAASGIGQSAEQLQSAIGDFKISVGEVLNGLKRDLAGTIDNMGESFAHNMTNISSTMAEATAGISGAVANLSENVGKTMESVQRSNEASIDIQKNAQREFLVTSGSLITNVEGMTTLVNDLREQIVSGLKAVSESGRRMVALDRRYNGVVDQAAQSAGALERLVVQLEGMQQSSPLQPVLQQMADQVGAVGGSLGSIDSHVLALTRDLKSGDSGEHVGRIRHAMDEVIEHLEGLDSRLQQISLERIEA